jgi:2-oxoglutarate dehydrogenase E2 component (dihydrolipoamide succinyltransferase)
MAIAELTMPKMGESIMEATILRWHKQVGDFVKMDETLLDIATDKVDSEVPSTAQGVITELLYNVNDVVPVGAVLARIQTEVAVAAEAPQPVVEAFTPVAPVAFHEPISVSDYTYQPEPIQAPPTQEFIPFVPAQATVFAPNNNRFFSPLVLNIANSEGLSLSELERISGTGADGRVSKKDVLQYIADKRAGRVSAFVHQPAPQQYYTAPVETVVSPIEEVFAAVPVETVVSPIEEVVAVAPVVEEVVHQKQDITSYPIAEVAEVAAVTAVAASFVEHTPTAEEEIIDSVVEEAYQHSHIHEAVEEMQASSSAAAETVSDFHVETPEEVVVEAPVAPIIAEAKPTPAPVAAPTVPEFDPSQYKNAEIVEMDRMRKLIAKHMVNSKQTSPHVTSFTEADVTNMVTWRTSIKEEFEKREGMKITFTPMFIECILKVMKRYPIINSSVVGDRIIMKKDFNIGMATALPSGNLIVPVIKNAADMSFISLTRSVNTLADNARNGRLSPDDVTEGTFTFTNVGTFGSLMGTPIINQPQVAILAVGEIKKRPVVVETDKGDFIGIRHMMYLSLSYDHRIIDGSIGASFLSDIAKELEAWDVNRQLKYVVKEWYVE